MIVKSIKKVFIFIIPFLLILYPLDIYLSKEMIEKGEGETSIWTDIFSSNINADIVIEGSSRASVHFDPILIEDSLNTSCYNLGLDGHSFLLQNFRHTEFLKYNRQPKLIVYEIGYSTFSDHKVAYNFDALLPYILFNNTIKESTEEYNYYHFADYYIPLVRYYGKVMSILQSKIPSKIKTKGYNKIDQEWNNNREIEFDSVKLAHDPALTPLFEEYIKDCKKKNIKLILVHPPEYIEHQNRVVLREQEIDKYKQLGEKYDIPFYDFSNDTLSFNKKYFKDALHLNARGSTIFTKKMIPILKSEMAAINSNFQEIK